MNLVSLLIAPAVILYSTGPDTNNALRITIAIVAALVVAGAVFVSKRRPTATGADLDDDGGTGAKPARPKAARQALVARTGKEAKHEGRSRWGRPSFVSVSRT